METKIFNEQALKKEIEDRWGKHGAHADVFNTMLKKIETLEKENEDIKTETLKCLDYTINSLSKAQYKLDINIVKLKLHQFSRNLKTGEKIYIEWS